VLRDFEPVRNVSSEESTVSPAWANLFVLFCVLFYCPHADGLGKRR